MSFVFHDTHSVFYCVKLIYMYMIYEMPLQCLIALTLVGDMHAGLDTANANIDISLMLPQSPTDGHRLLSQVDKRADNGIY